MATARRRSARLSRRSTPGRRKTQINPTTLGSLTEREGTPEGGVQPTLEAALYSSPSLPNTPSRAQLDELATIETPKTLPRLERAQMHPKEVHQTTANTPDSAVKLGFTDIPDIKGGYTLAAAQNTPSKVGPRPSLPQHLTVASFNFDSGHELGLSEQARTMMNSVREDAEKIKQQGLAARYEQERKDKEAHSLFGDLNAAGRKIAQPRGKAGRFSDVHMAQFKKMDSIANHPSSFRARPGFAQPTQQSLKRSGSKAGLNEDEQPHSARKSTPARALPVLSPVRMVTGTTDQISDAHSSSDAPTEYNPAKRRKSTFSNGLVTYATNREENTGTARPSTLPRPKSGVPASLLTPTKASLARSNTARLPLSSASKASMLPRSRSVKTLISEGNPLRRQTVHQNQVGPSDTTASVRPLPPLPVPTSDFAFTSPEVRSVPAMAAITANPVKLGLASRLPTFQGLKSILRSSRAAPGKTGLASIKTISAGNTPKRGNTAAPPESGSTRKVDFTPSTKSRYAVKLAAASPSPSKGDPAKNFRPSGLMIPYDPSAYLANTDSEDDWEDAESEVNYPVLPTGDDESIASTPPIVTSTTTHSFTRKVQEHTRRESKGFKSIFTTLEHPSRASHKPTTVNDVNTTVNVQEPCAFGSHQPNIVTRSPGSIESVTGKQSPASTIRPVRSSISGTASKQVQPFNGRVKTLPHGLPGKKRRRESDDEDDNNNNNSKLEVLTTKNRRKSIMPRLPGGWRDSSESKENKDPEQHQQNQHQQNGAVEDEGKRRGAKCARLEQPSKTTKPSTLREQTTNPNTKPQIKKPNKAREAAARNVKQRKDRIPNSGVGSVVKTQQGDGGGARGVLSMARLNMLSRPKERK